jgi:hypothetical protein
VNSLRFVSRDWFDIEGFKISYLIYRDLIRLRLILRVISEGKDIL